MKHIAGKANVVPFLSEELLSNIFSKKGYILSFALFGFETKPMSLSQV